MADDTGDGTPPTSSTPPPPARRTRRSTANANAPATTRRKPGPKPGSVRRPRVPTAPAAVVATVTEAVEPKVRKARQVVKTTAETVKSKAPQAKARAKRAVKATKSKVEQASPLRKGIVLGAVAAAASIIAGVVTLGRTRKAPFTPAAKPSEPATVASVPAAGTE